MRRIDYTNALNARANIEKRTIPATGVDNIALPVTAANTGMKAQIFGQSAENLVVNGDFRNGTTGWTVYGAALSISGNNAIVTGNGISAFPRIIYTNHLNSGDLHFAKIRFRVTNSDATSLKLGVGDNSALFLNISTPIQNNWYVGSGRASTTVTDRKIMIRSEYADAATTTGKVMEIDYCYVINLTATFGAGNEPTKEQCDILFADYFEGTANTIGTGRVRSVGVGGINPSSLYFNAGILRSNGLIKDEIRKGANGYELVKRVGVGTLGSEGINNGDFESGLKGSLGSGNEVSNYSLNTVSPISGIRDGRLTVTAVGTNVARPCIDILRNSSKVTGTWYELSLDYKLNSGICILNYIFNGATTTNVNKTLTGTGRLKLKYYVTGSSVLNYTTIYFNGTNLFDLQIDNISEKQIIPDTGTISSTSEFTELGSDIHYTLATPIITPIAHAGLLNSNSNGTVYFEPAIKDIITYTDKAEISDTDYPISSIESIEKNGIAVNPATAVIAEGGLSLTHPDLEVNDEVKLIYSYNKESTGRGMRLLFYNKA